MISNKQLACDQQIEFDLQQEQEAIEMQRIADEEDNGYDKREIPDMDFWEEQAFENERNGFVSALDDFEEEEL